MVNRRNSATKGLATLALASSLGLGGCGAVALGVGAGIGYEATKVALGQSQRYQNSRDVSIPLADWGNPSFVCSSVDFVGRPGFQGDLSFYDGKGLQYLNEKNSYAQISLGNITGISARDRIWGEHELNITSRNPNQNLTFMLETKEDLSAMAAKIRQGTGLR